MNAIVEGVTRGGGVVQEGVKGETAIQAKQELSGKAELGGRSKRGSRRKEEEKGTKRIVQVIDMAEKRKKPAKIYYNEKRSADRTV